MIEAADQFLRDNPIGLLFVVLALGYLIGKTKVRGFEAGPVTGVLFAGLLFGHLGYELTPAAQTFGFVMFIFSVGFQAGPGFFEVLRREGAKYFLLAVVVAATGFTLAAFFVPQLETPPLAEWTGLAWVATAAGTSLLFMICRRSLSWR